MIRTFILLLLASLTACTKDQIEKAESENSVEDISSWIVRKGTWGSSTAHYITGGTIDFFDCLTPLNYFGGGALGRILDAPTSDSLFISTDKPTSLWEDRPLTLGMQFTLAKPGKITALKFYKTYSGANPHIITLWNGSAIVTTTSIATFKTGWIRLPVDLSLTAGQYTLAVYNPYGRYGYANNLYPRTRGSVTAKSGKFEYGSVFPARDGTCYYLDVVCQFETIIPLSVKVTPDSLVMPYGVQTINVTGTVTGATSWQWEVLDSIGTWNITGLNTLTPVARPLDEGGCSVRLMLSAKDAAGLEQADLADIYVEPNPSERVGIITRSGKVFYLRRVVFY